MSSTYAPDTTPTPSSTASSSSRTAASRPSGGGYAEQAASLKPGATGYDAQVASLRPSLQLKDSTQPAGGSSELRQEVVLRLREATTDAERSEILQGAAAAGVVGVVEEKIDLGEGARVSTVTGELWVDGAGRIEAGYSAREVISDGVSKNTRSAALKYSSQDGLSGHAVSETSLTGAEGHELTTRREANLKDGQATVGAGETAVWVDDEGVEHRSQKSGEIGYGAKGAQVGFSGEQKREDELGSTTSSAYLNYNQKDGLDASAKQVVVVSAAGEDKTTQTRQISHKGGETSALASDEAVYVTEDGTKVTESKSAQVGHGKGGVTAQLSSDRSTELELDGQKVTTAGGRTLGYQNGTATAAANTRTSVVEGDDSKTSAASGNLSVSDKGVIEGGFSGEEVVTDGVSTRKKSASLGYTEKGGLTGEVGAERTLAAVEGHELTDRTGLKLEQGQATASKGQTVRHVTEDGVKVTDNKSAEIGFGQHGLTGQVAAGDVVDDGIASTSRKAHAGMNKDGFTAGAARERTVSAVEGDAITTSAGASYSGGNATFSRGEKATWTDPDGVAHSSGSSNTLTVGQSGVAVGHQRSDTTKNADGTSDERAAGVTANLSESQIGGNLSTTQKDKDGNKTGGAHAAGSLNLSADGRLEGVSGEAGIERKGVSVVVKGGYEYTIDPPKKSGDQWVVSMTVSQSAGGRIGGGKKVEGSLQGSISETRKEVRHFATKAEADAFHQSGPTAHEVGPAVTADDALKMAEGDSATEVDAASGGASAKGMLGPVSVGASITIGDSQSVTVTRAKSGVVEVLVTDTSMLGGGATIGAALLEMGYSGERSSAHSVKVAFDLNTSTGKSAFEAFRSSGQVPKSGCKLLAVSDSTTEKGAVTIGAGGAELKHGSTVTDSVTIAGGHKIEESTGTEDLGLTVPAVGHYKTSHGITSTQADEGEQVYNTRATIDATDAADSSQALGRALNHEANPNAAGSGSGTWVVNSSFTHDQMLDLTAAIKAGRFNSSSLIYHSGYGEAFEAAMRSAGGDPDQMRTALSTFVAAVGDRALDLIRDTIGGSFNYDYSLQGDEYLKGQAGDAEHRALVAELDRRLGGKGSKSALVKDVDKAIRAERERRDHLADGKNYPDLPRQLRAKEIGVSEERLAALEKLKGKAVEKAELERYERAEPEPQDYSDPDQLTSEMPVEEEPGYCEVDPELDKAYTSWDEAVAVRGRLDRDKARYEKDYYDAREAEWVHDGAYTGWVARKELGYTSWLGDGDYAADYQLIDEYMGQGRSYWKQAQSTERGARAALDSLETDLACGEGDPVRLQARIAAAQRELEKALKLYYDAAYRFRMALSRYQAIEKANRDKRAYWEGYNHRMPAGQGL